MDDKVRCKAPPDRPPTDEALAPNNYKNKNKQRNVSPSTPKRCSASQANMAKGKQESPSQLALNNNNDSISEQVDPSPTLHDIACCDETMKKNHASYLSYRDSLLRPAQNRVSNTDAEATDEEDDLLHGLLNKSWELAQPSEQVQKLMNLYPVAGIEQDEYNDYCKLWNTSLIITILGLRLNVHQLKERLKRIWGIPDFEIIDQGNNFFSIRFTDTENWAVHYKKVLFEGPWVVSQHHVLVQMWTPYFDPYQNPLSRVVTWVRVHAIPLFCYNKIFLSRLGETIGKTLKIDKNTLSGYSAQRPTVLRGKFARICVELDLQKKLVPRLIIANGIFDVEYEGLGLICSACGRYGHPKGNCPSVLQE